MPRSTMKTDHVHLKRNKLCAGFPGCTATVCFGGLWEFRSATNVPVTHSNPHHYRWPSHERVWHLYPHLKVWLSPTIAHLPRCIAIFSWGNLGFRMFSTSNFGCVGKTMSKTIPNVTVFIDINRCSGYQSPKFPIFSINKCLKPFPFPNFHQSSHIFQKNHIIHIDFFSPVFSWFPHQNMLQPSRWSGPKMASRSSVSDG